MVPAIISQIPISQFLVVARATGVTRHMRVDEAKRLCPEMIFAHVATYKIGEIDFKYHEKPNQRTHKVSLDPYRRASMKIFGILKEFCPLHVQKASVDEGKCTQYGIPI